MEAFEAAAFDLRAMTVQDYIQDDYPHTAFALAESLVERYPGDPRIRQLLGDAWQGLGAQTRIDPAELSNSDKRQNRRERVSARVRSGSRSCSPPTPAASRTPRT